MPPGPIAMWSMFARPRPGTRRSWITITLVLRRWRSRALAVAASPSAPCFHAWTLRGSPASAAMTDPTGPCRSRTRRRRANARRSYSCSALAPALPLACLSAPDTILTVARGPVGLPRRIDARSAPSRRYWLTWLKGGRDVRRRPRRRWVWSGAWGAVARTRATRDRRAHARRRAARTPFPRRR